METFCTEPARLRRRRWRGTTWYHWSMAMTLRLDDAQTEALRRKAAAEHRSMQQVALAAIDAYVQQPTPQRRRAVPTRELQEAFADLPPVDAERFRADEDRYVDSAMYFDAYERARQENA
jgi:predicted transcriptional regulator